jgi:hypothetical protein
MVHFLLKSINFCSNRRIQEIGLEGWFREQEEKVKAGCCDKSA